MLKKIWKNLIVMLYRDVNKESESNDLSVLLRFLSLSQIFWLLLLSIVMAFESYAFLCLSCVLTIGILTSCMILTYEDRTPAGMYVYISVNHILVIICCYETEWKLLYAPMILACIMLFFFNARVKMKTKVYYALGEFVFAIALMIADQLLPLKTSMRPLPAGIVTGINIATHITAVSLEAYAYSLKYTKNEEKILQYNKKLEDMVSTDALTGLWNRRAMNEHLSLLENSFRKHQKSFSVAIMDIDFFKKVNDTYGHGMGDFVLKTLSSILKEEMEGKGSVARWGGEEFLLTFEEMKFEDAVKHLDDLREKIAVWDFSFKDVKLHLTITGGIEDYAMTDSIDAVITKADERLYTGKTGGRNKIVSRG